MIKFLNMKNNEETMGGRMMKGGELNVCYRR